MEIGILCLFIGSNLTFLWVGFRMAKGSKQVEESEAKPAKKIYKPKFRAGDLLDPVTPEEQRLDRMLQLKEKEDARHGE